MVIVKCKNGIRHLLAKREKARYLREQGSTHREIAGYLNVGLGTAYLWTSDIKISEEQKLLIQKRKSQKVFTPAKRLYLAEQAIQRLKKFQFKEKYTAKNLLNKISDFYAANGRIPLKREFNMHREYLERFGGWNKAIKLAGFCPNPVVFANKFKAKDGHSCDSFTEKVIDDWFYKNGIVHNRNFRYGKTKMTADFFIGPKSVVEFFGLAGVQAKYDNTIIKKRKIAQELGLCLIELYPSDIFPKNKLREILTYILT